MKRAFLLIAAAVAAIAADPGIKPRSVASDYAAHSVGRNLAVGASFLTRDQVHSMFSADLNRGYLVIEVGAFPANSGRLDLGPGDFMLRVAGTERTDHPVAPRVVAAVLQKSAASDRDVTVYPQVGVGYENGPGYYDPMTGRRRGGLTTSVGTGVGIGGNPGPGSTGRDRNTMELELSEQQVPEKVTATPVAGYLYFPAPKKQKPGAYELIYNGPGGKLIVPLEIKASR